MLVWRDRFHAHVMQALQEVKNAIRYVLENFRHHLREDVAPQGVDPCSSAGWRTIKQWFRRLRPLLLTKLVRYQRSHLSRARFRGAGDLAAARHGDAGPLALE